MALSKDDLDALDEAIACAELTVKIDGREVTYRSIDDLIKARRHTSRVLLGSSGKSVSGLGGITTRVNRGIR